MVVNRLVQYKWFLQRECSLRFRGEIGVTIWSVEPNPTVAPRSKDSCRMEIDRRIKNRAPVYVTVRGNISPAPRESEP